MHTQFSICEGSPEGVGVTLKERVCEIDEFFSLEWNAEGVIGDESEGGDCDEVICTGWDEPGGQWTEWGWRMKKGAVPQCGDAYLRGAISDRFVTRKIQMVELGWQQMRSYIKTEQRSDWTWTALPYQRSPIQWYYLQESRAAARKPRDAASVLFCWSSPTTFTTSIRLAKLRKGPPFRAPNMLTHNAI